MNLTVGRTAASSLALLITASALAGPDGPIELFGETVAGPGSLLQSPMRVYGDRVLAPLSGVDEYFWIEEDSPPIENSGIPANPRPRFHEVPGGFWFQTLFDAGYYDAGTDNYTPFPSVPSSSPRIAPLGGEALVAYGSTLRRFSKDGVMLEQFTDFIYSRNLIGIGGMAYCTTDGLIAPLLWRSDGTESGTQTFDIFRENDRLPDVVRFLGTEGNIIYALAERGSQIHLEAIDVSGPHHEALAAFPQSNIDAWRMSPPDAASRANAGFPQRTVISSPAGDIAVLDEGQLLRTTTIPEVSGMGVDAHDAVFLLTGHTPAQLWIWPDDEADPRPVQLTPGGATVTTNGAPHVLPGGRAVLMTIQDDALGEELWWIAAAAPQPVLVQDFIPGPGATNIGPLMRMPDRIVFRAFVPETGIELYQVRLDDLPKAQGTGMEGFTF